VPCRPERRRKNESGRDKGKKEETQGRGHVPHNRVKGMKVRCVKGGAHASGGQKGKRESTLAQQGGRDGCGRGKKHSWSTA